MFAAAAEEMQASPHELAGRLLARSQGIETQMKLYITRSDQATKLESLEGKTFGQLLGIFTKHSQDQTLNDWLESMRQSRNDVAHTFFRDNELMKLEFGPAVAKLNHKALRKMLRISEICHALLSKLLEQTATKGQ